ncbi:pleckstrin homology domain-containing family J member 1 isoform X4 [Mus musculus]|uniref:pleckstrin homology domain-containing family J member 1 isoform X4 n=1 Tax=Mus musculus TaxID=10090 RepID=UPI0003D731F6|nr:pleckstrin homology domain-containing family J member 1 isoform X4 [Mus musculus]|eukprot:XP_006514390.1 PREDICTED: pleckstrin homology domain-containing family J member 1 isoform X4 [Mus musculus]
MRYNEKELQALSRQPAEMAAELGMRGPKKGSGFVEDLSRKYHFECCSQEQCQDWMEALQRASYEYMRQSLIFYRNEIRKMTGKVCGAVRDGTAFPGLAHSHRALHRTPWSSLASPRRPGSS